jgi:hypothetical protein
LRFWAINALAIAHLQPEFMSYRKGGYTSWNGTGKMPIAQFSCNASSLEPLEQKFLPSAGEVIDAVRHFNGDGSNASGLRKRASWTSCVAR